MEDLLAAVIALWFSMIFMWIWNFSLHKRIEKLECVNGRNPAVRDPKHIGSKE